MATQNTTLVPAAIEVINQVSGSYSALFGDGLLAVTESLDTVRAAKSAIEALHSERKDSAAYHLILALYDLAAIEIPMAIIELEPYQEGVDRSLCVQTNEVLPSIQRRSKIETQESEANCASRTGCSM